MARSTPRKDDVIDIADFQKLGMPGGEREKNERGTMHVDLGFKYLKIARQPGTYADTGRASSICVQAVKLFYVDSAYNNFRILRDSSLDINMQNT